MGLELVGGVSYVFPPNRIYPTKGESTMNEKFLIEKMEEGYLFYLKDGIIKNVEIPVYGKLTLVYQDGKMIYLEKAETIK